MHPFPPADELQFLIGEEVSQVCLDPYGLQFRFVSLGQISVDWRIEHVDRDGQSHVHDCQAQTPEALYLQQLLQHRITKVETEPYCLSLTFDDGAVLQVFSYDGPYECGHIWSSGNQLALVF